MLMSIPLISKFIIGTSPDKMNTARLIASGLKQAVLGEGLNTANKGWIHPKTKKIHITKGMRPYHVEFIAKKPRDFGVSMKDIMSELEKYYDHLSAPDPEKEAKYIFGLLLKGEVDKQKLIEYLAMKKGWYRVVGADWSEITGLKINDKIIHDILNIMEDERVIPYNGQGIKSIICAEYRYNNSMDYPDEKTIKVLEGDAIVRALRGKKTGKRTEIGQTMAMFRGEAVIQEGDCEVYTAKQMADLEKFADRLLNKFGIDIEFTKHFRDRMNDSRNRPCIKISELQQLFKKMNKAGGRRIKGHGEGQAVVFDIQRDLNLPVVIDMTGKGEFEVRAKTIMRKKNFKTPDKKILY